MRISDWSSDVCSSDLRDDGPMNKSNNTMVVNCVAYSSAGERQDIALDDISETLAADSKGFVWVGTLEPDEPLMQTLQHEFGLHELAVEDAHHAHQRPKIEEIGRAHV